MSTNTTEGYGGGAYAAGGYGHPQVTIDTFDAWTQHTDTPHADLSVSWAASDAAGKLAYLLIRIEDENGETITRAVVEEHTPGDRSTGSWDHRVHKGADRAYTVTLLAEASDGRTATQSKPLPVPAKS